MVATQLTAETSTIRAPGWMTRHPAWLMFVVALLVGVPARIAVGRGMPLWFDETFTATIATQPTFSGLVHWCLNELSGPAFYMPMWVWVKIAGPSTEALRLPGVLLTIAAPLLLAVRGHPDRDVRLLWGAVALLWLPILSFANDARPYPQLFFLGSVQAVAFLRLIRRPSVAAALMWSVATAAMILTHYAALAVGGAQGIAYLAIHRRRAMATWPALAAFAPAAAWVTCHITFAWDLTAKGPGATAPADRWAVVRDMPALLFGTATIGAMILAIVAATLALRRWRVALDDEGCSPETALVASGAVAWLATAALGIVHTGFAPRYLIVSAPALLFGLAWWLRASARVDARPAILVLAIMVSGAAGALGSAISDRSVDPRHLFGFDQASRWLASGGAKRVTFLWTDPMGDMAIARNPAGVADIAGFTFRRDGHPVQITTMRPRPGDDASAIARHAAGETPGSAILWVANDSNQPNPTIVRVEQQDGRWQCRDFGGGHVTVQACRWRGRA